MATAFCFDLDGTLTKKEILPILADELNIYEEMALLTKITMDGILPFESSFKLRVKLLSSIPNKRIRELIAQVEVDENMTNFIRSNKNNCYIITGNLDVWIGEFIEQTFGCKYFCSEAILDDNGNIQHIKKIVNKGKEIENIKALGYSKIVAVGDGMNDCSMFQNADLSIAYGGIHNPVESLISLSDYVIYSSKAICKLMTNLI